MLVFFAIPPAAAEPSFPDLRGTWKGESESIVSGGNPHHGATPSPEPRYNSVPFTLTIDKQDGRRFSGTFSSPQSSETLVGVISRTGRIHAVDDDGFTSGTLLAPDRMELCYQQLSAGSRIASCAELVKQR